jgi:hypothetical protein
VAKVLTPDIGYVTGNSCSSAGLILGDVSRTGGDEDDDSDGPNSAAGALKSYFLDGIAKLEGLRREHVRSMGQSVRGTRLILCAPVGQGDRPS